MLSHSNNDFSGNPIIINQRTADASPQVWSDGKLWIYKEIIFY